MSPENSAKRYEVNQRLKGRDIATIVEYANIEPDGVNKCYSLPKRDDFYTLNMKFHSKRHIDKIQGIAAASGQALEPLDVVLKRES